MKLKTILAFLLFACGTALAQTNDCASLTHQALDLSGFNQTIDYMANALASDQFVQQLHGRQDSEQFFNALQPVLKKEFSSEILRRELQNRIAARCDAEQMRQTIEKLQSPFIARMLTLEAATNSAEGQAKLQRYINIAQTVPPTDDRMDALEKLDESAGISDFVTDFQMAMFRGILTGAGAPKEVLDQIPLRRREMKEQRQNYVELGMSVTYHGVTRPELLQYAGELSAPPLKGFYSLVRKTFVEIVGERSQAMGRDLKPIIGSPAS